MWAGPNCESGVSHRADKNGFLDDFWGQYPATSDDTAHHERWEMAKSTKTNRVSAHNAHNAASWPDIGRAKVSRARRKPSGCKRLWPREMRARFFTSHLAGQPAAKRGMAFVEKAGGRRTAKS